MDMEQRKGEAIMVKKQKNRKWSRIVTVAILIVAISAGLTYAWFTASSGPGDLSVTMGNMEIGANFELPLGVGEPGLVTDLEGVISNEGSVGVLIKMDMSPKTLIKWQTDVDADGRDVLVSLLDEPIEIPDDPNVGLTGPLFNENVLPYGYDDETGALYMWYKDKNSDDYYLLIDGEMAVDILYEIAMDGDGMGNRYQDAEIVLAGDLQSTQWWSDDALMDLFGITWDDLENYPDESGNGRSSFAIDPVKALVLERIEELRTERN